MKKYELQCLHYSNGKVRWCKIRIYSKYSLEHAKKRFENHYLLYTILSIKEVI